MEFRDELFEALPKILNTLELGRKSLTDNWQQRNPFALGILLDLGVYSRGVYMQTLEYKFENEDKSFALRSLLECEFMDGFERKTTKPVIDSNFALAEMEPDVAHFLRHDLMC